MYPWKRVQLFIPLILLGMSLLLALSGRDLHAQTASPFGGFLSSQDTPETAEVEIAQIDEIRIAPPLAQADSARIAEHKPIETGWKATVQGTISRREFQVFLLVRALTSGTWLVQAPAARPSKTGIWRTSCLLGTERKGQDEDYEIIAVASLKRDQYRTGQRIPANQFPPDNIPQSESIHVRRVRSPNP